MDVRSVTGSNLRNIMLLLDKSKVEEVRTEDWNNIVYFKQQNEDKWKNSLIWDIIETKAGVTDILSFDFDELELILHNVCTE